MKLTHCIHDMSYLTKQCLILVFTRGIYFVNVANYSILEYHN